jgi:ubiquinone/menaquinone biosynthesis C-methylase UbiE
LEHGDFSALAKKYINRPAYNLNILEFISNTVAPENNNKYNIAEIGAGTGKLTKMLSEMGFNVFAVEPNDDMRREGEIYTKDLEVKWSKGTGEETGLDTSVFDWVIMASSFHWTNPDLSLPEFYRILKPNGFITIIWNPRNIMNSKLHIEIEDIVHTQIPNLNRVSSGGRSKTKKWEDILGKTGHFKNVIYSEIAFEEEIIKEKYIGAWESVNDIRVQAGEEKFNLIISRIKEKISGLDVIKVPYKNTAWTAQRID